MVRVLTLRRGDLDFRDPPKLQAQRRKNPSGPLPLGGTPEIDLCQLADVIKHLECDIDSFFLAGPVRS